MKQNRIKRVGSDDGKRQISSPDGRLSFILARARTGVHIQRFEQLDKGSYAGTVSLQMVFTTGDEFELFCQADEMRFKQPLVYHALTREFHDLLHAAP